MCDHGPCGSAPGGCCFVDTTAELQDDGAMQVLYPAEWARVGDKVMGPHCAERLALAKAIKAPVPDPADDPPSVAATRAKRLEWMRQSVREALEEDGLKNVSQARIDAELVKMARDLDDGEPDFYGHPSSASELVEVRVRGTFVEIAWPRRQGMSLTIRHENFKVLDPPPFLDNSLVKWVESCLATMDGDVTPREDPMAQ